MYFLILFFIFGCQSNENILNETTGQKKYEEDTTLVSETEKPLFCNDLIAVGAERSEEYLPLLYDKKIALVANQSSRKDTSHLVDFLLESDIDVIKVFSPEHGFRGEADAGEKVNSERDAKTGLPIVSLYGKHKKPTSNDLSNVDAIVFDLQDVGVRFYTYVSTMTYVMEAAAENGIQMIILDRPNPNGHYVDGPMLKEGYSSFIGMHQVPVVHGMTLGEYAQMLNGEGWLEAGLKCELTVITVANYTHKDFYEVPIKPSPNLPNAKSIYWYPSLCFFEGTKVSIGRGTETPFQIVGHPDYEVDVLDDLYSFKPMPNDGSKHPKLEGETCYGYDLSQIEIKELQEMDSLNLKYLFDFYGKLGAKKDFFLENNFIDLLYGSNELRLKMLEGVSLKEIRDSWQEELEQFRAIRSKYLLYEDFE